MSSSGAQSAAAGVSALVRTAVKTANYSAAVGDLVACDPTGGAFTVTLPTAPADKSQVEVKVITATAPFAVTVACGGSDVFNRAAGATSSTLTVAGQGATFQYDHATSIWTVISSDTPLAQVDTLFTRRIPKIMVPAVRPAPDVQSIATGAANKMYLARFVVPETGHLRDVSWFVGVASGNVLAVVYDTGDALAGSYSLLASTGSIAAAGSSAWQIAGDPNLAVTAGQQLMVGVLISDGVVQFGRSTVNAAGVVQLPTGFAVAPGGALPKMAGSVSAGSFVAPATIAEASLTTIAFVPSIIARIS